MVHVSSSLSCSTHIINAKSSWLILSLRQNDKRDIALPHSCYAVAILNCKALRTFPLAIDPRTMSSSLLNSRPLVLSMTSRLLSKFLVLQTMCQLLYSKITPHLAMSFCPFCQCFNRGDA